MPKKTAKGRKRTGSHSRSTRAPKSPGPESPPPNDSLKAATDDLPVGVVRAPSPPWAPNTFFPERDPSYRCSGCGFVTQTDDDFASMPTLPKFDEIAAAERWRTCPANEGTVDGYLWDEHDHSRRCRRHSFAADGETIRVCTPVAQMGTQVKADGSEWVSVGGAMTLSEMAAAWKLRQHLAWSGPMAEPDLAHVASGTPNVPMANSLVAVDDAGRWHLRVPRVEAYGDWATKIFHSPVLRDLDRKLEYLDLAREVDLLVAPFSERGAEAALNTQLYVPFDLRLPIEEQWENLRPKVREVQRLMLAYCGRERPYSPEPEILYRDIYCYALATWAKWSTSQIAEEVFPRERPRAAASKVRKILSELRKRLRTASAMREP
jgi:hypothetical protein